MTGYIPPFTISSKAITLMNEISEIVGRMTLSQNLRMSPRLRRINRLKSIQSSLEIENNTLTLDQVTAIIDGKRVLGNPVEILEVRNAFAAYELIPDIDSCDVNDLLRVHSVMLSNIMDDAGRFRSSGVGIYAGKELIHMAPPADLVPKLIGDLLTWLHDSDVHPLIKSCVYHYEFEFIHPFSDGNGRMGRLWHTAILSEWRELFQWIPIESIVRDHQMEYYDAIGKSTSCGDSGPFIDLMLSLILEALKAVDSRQSVELSDVERKVFNLIREDIFISASNAAIEIGVNARTIERALKTLKDLGLIERSGSNRSGHWHVADDTI